MGFLRAPVALGRDAAGAGRHRSWRGGVHFISMPGLGYVLALDCGAGVLRPRGMCCARHVLLEGSVRAAPAQLSGTTKALAGHSLHPGRGSGLCQMPKATHEVRGSTN